MIPFYIIAQVSAAAGQLAVHQAAERQRLGLPPIVIPPKTTEQIKQEKEDDRLCGLIFFLYFSLDAIIFCGPPIMLIICVLKFAFAAQGVEFP